MCRNVPRHFLQVECHVIIDSALCNIPCEQKLACGHACTGVCDGCHPLDMADNSLQHKICEADCKKTLGCNHQCPGGHPCGDSSLCSPCSEPCSTKCSHTSCPLLCSEPCVPCKLPCSYSCRHVVCTALCSETHYCIPVVSHGFPAGLVEHNAVEEKEQLCAMKCPKLLRCGHPCMGICGEECPPVCAVCKRVRTASYILLECGHYFDIIILDKLMLSTPDDKVPACPNCGKNVRGTYRYSIIMRDRLRSLETAHLNAMEKKLLRDVLRDMKDGGEPLDVIINSLLIALKTKPRNVHPIINLMLGKVYQEMGRLQDAETYYLNASKCTIVSSWIHRETFTCLGYLRLSDGKLDGLSGIIENSSIKKLEITSRCFEAASKAPSDRDVDALLTIGRYSTLNDMISNIEEKIYRLREEEKLSKQKAVDRIAAYQKSLNQDPVHVPGAAQVSFKQDSVHVPAAVPVDISTLFPPVPPSVPARVLVPTNGGSVLHHESARGNLKQVWNAFCFFVHITQYHISYHIDGQIQRLSASSYYFLL